MLAGTLGAGGTIAADRAIDPYTDTGAVLEIAKESAIDEAGEIKTELLKAKPGVTLSKWDGEAAMTVSYDGVKGAGSRAFLTNRMEWKDAKQEVHAYPIQASAGVGEDGGFEIEVILNERPSSNVFNFPVEGVEDLDFFYQAPLNEEMASSTCTPTDCGDTHRPENVVGSFSVYYRDHVNHIEGQTNYATGKAYHIYRPKAADAKGKETWALLNYKTGVLSVEVPQEFLDEATYPIVVDPTFGYTTIGGTNTASNAAHGSKFSTIEAGTISAISIYAKRNGASATQDAAIYSDSAGTPTSKLAVGSATISVGSVATWSDVSLTYAFSTATYWTMQWCNDASGCSYYYDTGAANQRSLDSTTNSSNFNTWPSSWTNGGFSARMESIYATYTAGGGGSGSTPLDTTSFEVFDN